MIRVTASFEQTCNSTIGRRIVCKASAGISEIIVSRLSGKAIEEWQILSSAHAIEVAVSRVLVGIDFSDCSDKALHHAIAISRSYGAKFYFAHVVSSLGFAMAGPEVAATAAEATSRDVQKLESYLLQTGALTGISYEAKVLQGGDIWHELERVVHGRR